MRSKISKVSSEGNHNPGQSAERLIPYLEEKKIPIQLNGGLQNSVIISTKPSFIKADMEGEIAAYHLN